MEIYQFEQFRMIAECGTMREAAERLYLSQPTLSHNLKKLESELGCQLFTRANNQLRLTQYGELVLKRTREIDGSFKATTDDFGDFCFKKVEGKRRHLWFEAEGFVTREIAGVDATDADVNLGVVNMYKMIPLG